MTRVEITLTLPDFAAYAEKINREVPGLIAATLQTNRGMIFDKSGRYNGRRKWKKLRCRSGMPLKDRGTLSQSMGPRNDGLHPGHATGSILRMTGALEGTVTVGTNIAYAAIQNDGGVIYPKTAKALRFKCRGKWVFAKKVTIPARPFNDWTREDGKELVETIENYIGHVLAGGQ
jgi:phage gpG-like protein